MSKAPGAYALSSWWPGGMEGQAEVPHLAFCKKREKRKEESAGSNRFKSLEVDEDEEDSEEKDINGKEEAEVARTLKGRRAKEGKRLQICVAKEPEGIAAVKEDEEWEEIELTVDSGATDTVIQPKALPSVETKEGPAFKRGVEYEMANGEYAPNLGEKKFHGMTEEGCVRGLTAQVVDVSQNLLSVHRCVKAGNRVVFDGEGSYVENKKSGEINWFTETGNLWTLKLWVKKGFLEAGSWQGRRGQRTRCGESHTPTGLRSVRPGALKPVRAGEEGGE